MTTPRVLIVVASTDRRGGEISGSTLAAEMRRRGVDAEVVALAPGKAAVRLPLKSLGSRPKSLSTFRSLRSFARDFDVVVAYGSSSLPAAAISLIGSRVPFVYRSIGDPLQWAGGRLHQLRTSLLFARAALVVTLFQGAADSMHSLYRVRRNRLVVIGNARSPIVEPASGTERSDVRREVGISEDARIVLFVGSLSEEKRVHLAIEAVTAMPDVHLLIAGSGPLADELRHSIGQDALPRVHFLGARADVPRLLRASDVLVLPSRTEGMPGVVIEAGMHGVASVAADVGAVSEMIEDGVSGRVVPSGDAPALIVGLRDVLEDPTGFGSRARARFQDLYIWDVVVPKWIEALKQITSAHQVAAG